MQENIQKIAPKDDFLVVVAASRLLGDCVACCSASRVLFAVSTYFTSASRALKCLLPLRIMSCFVSYLVD